MFNNAAQVWNHTFFWESMKPGGGGEPTGALADAITKSFGSFAEFKDQYAAAGATQFGSGWAWLVTDSAGNLSIEKTPNAVLPMVTGALTFWHLSSLYCSIFFQLALVATGVLPAWNL